MASTDLWSKYIANRNELSATESSRLHPNNSTVYCRVYDSVLHSPIATRCCRYFVPRIDEIDRSLFDVVSQRMELSDKIGEYKKANDISVLQLNRYRELLSNSLAYAERHNLNKDFVKQLVELIHQESINRQLRDRKSVV